MASVATGQTTIGFPEPVSFVIDLTIPKFSSLITQTDGIESAEVLTCKSSWTLKLYPLETTDEGTSCVAAYFYRKCLNNNDRPIIYVESQFSVMTVKNGTASKATWKFCRDFHQLFGLIPPTETQQRYGARPLILHSSLWGDGATLHLDHDTLT
ncbi:hypothetical protein RvY_17836 [Ramazzottius varieornatus]|uniref:MATH domain-containing protein n=1 Tax=Ramazzottius varieornatus TaxID=947166 RepID=A0A1D1W995_RAMVA|nr:hypothetical protein RvY_17836 [Ramazzottius varieornatus]